MIRKLLALTMSLTLILSGCGQGTVSTPPGTATKVPMPTMIMMVIRSGRRTIGNQQGI